MRPEDIQNRDFLVGLRGYDKEEVRSFLAQVASEHATLRAELDDARTVAMARASAPVPAASGSDDFENLGASVAAVLRAAKDSARELLEEAEERRVHALEAAEEAVRQAHADAEQIRTNATSSVADAQAEAERIRASAQTSVADAHVEAERIIREATERANQIEIGAEARLANLHEEATRREAATRTRLLEASDEIQLALVALGEAAPQPETVDLRDEEAPALG